ncbi:hypothetical protein NP493_1617g00052 [Ridgeia piscesae]|uniref:Uncharacterized protein n=1 Tax=Ridgeia piscesae TaxID=27915 RepID=A0AAD9JYR1_RIDPI|nr:hypothetical protein NP493_1617g00052 [Ridgeia piscesae]
MRELFVKPSCIHPSWTLLTRRKRQLVWLTQTQTPSCLNLEDIEMYAFSPAQSQWLPRPQNACWRSGLVIKHRVPDNIHASFTVRISGHRLVCTMSHLKVMTRRTELSDCGLVSGNYNICKLSGVTEQDPGNLSTCVAACKYKKNKTKYVIIEIPNRHMQGLGVV